MDPRVVVHLSSSPMAPMQESPIFLLDLNFHYKHNQYVRDLQGRVSLLHSSETTHYHSTRPVDPVIFADFPTCKHHLDALLSSYSFDLHSQAFMSENIASFLVICMTAANSLSGFRAVANVEYATRELLDMQESVRVMLMFEEGGLDAEESVEESIEGDADASINATALEKLKNSGTWLYAAAESSGGGGDGCAICMEEFCDGEEVMKMPACAHIFHEKCILCWVEKRNSCPNCRHQVYE